MKVFLQSLLGYSINAGLNCLLPTSFHLSHNFQSQKKDSLSIKLVSVHTGSVCHVHQIMYDNIC